MLVHLLRNERVICNILKTETGKNAAVEKELNAYFRTG